MRRPRSRIPKVGVHSAPEYVVGTETRGSPVSAEIAFAEVDRASAADCQDAVGALGQVDGVHDPVGRHLAPLGGHPHGRIPARARDEERTGGTELRKHTFELAEAPADDHSRARANSTNASATRVDTRPPARTREISRDGSRPRTRASASVPVSSSRSTAVREMNVTP